MTALDRPAQVIFLPGIIMPAALRYGPLLGVLGNSAQAVTKELEVYTTTPPSPDYSIEQEVEGIRHAAMAAGFDRFHLYSHSAGGACALAFVTTYPDRVLSLALDEPASDFSPEAKSGLVRDIQALDSLPEAERNKAFVAMQLAPGVEPPAPPPGPPPDWMANRPAGTKAFIEAMQRFDVAPSSYLAFDRPVYFSYGSLSSSFWADMRDRLAGQFPDFTAERYEGLHHFQTSHSREPDRVASALKQLWARSAQGEAHEA
jgi:pimeloyl-ACP methyl ester carboxylesterase